MENLDPVTKTLNRAVFDREFPKDLQKALDSDNPLSLIMIDIDHFKKVNDQHGHQKGDSILFKVGKLLQRISQGKGKVFRYGGEEMVIVLPNYNQNEAIALAERCRCQLESSDMDAVRVTASFGVATSIKHGHDSVSLIKSADLALYDAKNKGRNLVRVYGDPDPIPQQSYKARRKEAESGRLTDSQKEELRQQHFQGCQILCPQDSGELEVFEINKINFPMKGIHILCPICGLSEKIEPW